MREEQRQEVGGQGQQESEWHFCAYLLGLILESSKMEEMSGSIFIIFFFLTGICFCKSDPRLGLSFMGSCYKCEIQLLFKRVLLFVQLFSLSYLRFSLIYFSLDSKILVVSTQSPTGSSVVLFCVSRGEKVCVNE